MSDVSLRSFDIVTHMYCLSHFCVSSREAKGWIPSTSVHSTSVDRIGGRSQLPLRAFAMAKSVLRAISDSTNIQPTFTPSLEAPSYRTQIAISANEPFDFFPRTHARR